MAIAMRIYRVWIVLCLVNATAMELYAQNSPFDPEMREQASIIQDKVIGFTDRSLYISGETIRFMASVQTSGVPADKDWSRVLYVELISASGDEGMQGKYPIANKTASGEINIPDGLLTGTYFLRLYTRWMRNRGPLSYCYIPLKIINPFSPELSDDLAEENGEGMLSLQSVQRGTLNFSGASGNIGRGESMKLDLDLDGSGASGSVQGCLTVVPVAALPQGPVQAENIDAVRKDSFLLNFLPDLYGATLSGSVVNPMEEAEAVPDTRIHFTLMGEQTTYFTAHSDAHGKFTVTLPPREGKLELLVQPESHAASTLEVRIDQDFDPVTLPLDVPEFSLSQRERQTLTLMARNYQLSQIYMDFRDMEEHDQSTHSVPFYGTPSFSLNMDDFVLLPTLEEVFINLVTDVTTLKRRNRTTLIIASENPAMSIFAPLTMIDQVPLFDMKQFLSVSPAKISRIDVVSDVYVKGDMRFGGVINLHSREGDIAGIDLDENSFFIDFQAIYQQVEVLEDSSTSGDQMPDMRNTVLWIPEMQVNRSGSQSISFIAPDYPGEYVALFRGWNDQGELVSAEFPITVR